MPGSGRDPETDEQLASVARLYFLDNLDQQAIAEIVGVSRSKVSRMLTAARERNIVRISVDPYEPRALDLEGALTARYGLRHSVVIKGFGAPAASLRRAIGHYAAPVIQRLIGHGDTVGVSGGRTLGELADAMRRPDERRMDLKLVQLMGHIGLTARQIDAPELCRGLANRLGGAVYAVNAPAYVQTAAVRDGLAAHDDMRSVSIHFGQLNLALVGIGSLTESAFVERGIPDAETRAGLLDRGAAGEICGRYFDAQGRECDSEIRGRTISIELDVLRQAPERVGVTLGVNRAEATRAALAGGLVSSLVIDAELAGALLA